MSPHTSKSTVRYCSLLFHRLLQMGWEQCLQLPPRPLPLSRFITWSLDLVPLLVSLVSSLPKVRDCPLEGPHDTYDLMLFSSKLPVPVHFLFPKSQNLLHPRKRQFFSLKAKVLITHKLLHWEHILWTGAQQNKSGFNAPSPVLLLHRFEAQEYELHPANNNTGSKGGKMQS